MKKILINRKMKLFKRESIITKIILCYTIALFILCLINFTSYSVIKKTLINKEISNGESYLKYLSMIMDQKLTEIHNQSYTFLTNKDNINRMKNIRTIENQYRLNNEINNIKNSIGVADKVFLCSPGEDIVCSDSGVFYTSDYMKENYNWTQDECNKLNNMMKENKGFFVASSDSFTKNDNTTMIIVTSVIASEYSSRLVIYVDKEKYSSTVLHDVGKIGSVYIVNDMGDLLFSSQKQQEDKDEIKKVISNDNRTMTVDNNIALKRKSNYFKGCYMMLIPKGQISDSIHNISVLFFAACAVFILLWIVTSLGLFRLSYMPIYNILLYYKDLFNDNHEITNEYTYIMNGLRHIKTEKSEYNDKMLLFNLFQNGMYQKEIEDMFSYECFVVGIVRMSDKSMLNPLLEYIADSEDSVKYVGIGEYKYVVIVNSDESDIDYYISYFTEMKKHIESTANSPVLITLSDMLSGSDKINLLYRHAILTHNNARCMDIDKVFTYSDNDNLQLDKLYFTDNIEENIIYSVRNGIVDLLEEKISEVFSKNQNINFYLLEVLNMRFLNIYYKLKLNDDTKKIEHYDDSYFEREYNIAKIQNQISDMFLSLIPEKKINGDSFSKIQSFVISYTDENYNSPDFNIDLIAEQLKFSVSYTSKIFKQATGSTFKDYLINKRVKEAKLLIDTTNYSIKEISEMVGAGTYNSFVRMFKNKVGISPGQYRKMSDGNEERQ